MSLRLAQRVQRIRPSPTVSITALAGQLREEGKDIIGLSAGEPDRYPAGFFVLKSPEARRSAGFETKWIYVKCLASHETWKCQ